MTGVPASEIFTIAPHAYGGATASGWYPGETRSGTHLAWRVRVDGNGKCHAMRLENIAWTCLACALVGACLVLVIIA